MTPIDAREWKKRNPNFPLSVHPSGQWCRKVRGKIRYFGILADPDAALNNWLGEKDYWMAGMIPVVKKSGTTVEELFKAHIKDVDDRISAGKLAPKTRRDYIILPELFNSLSVIPVNSLEPQHFSIVLKKIEKSGRSLRTQKNVIMATKAVFNWGKSMGIVNGINFGPRFITPSIEKIEAEQEDSGKIRFIEREIIINAIAAAKPKMKVAILLGINCGFYPGDTVAITLDHLHLDEAIPYHDFRRVKTSRRRMAVLWPETVAAIEDYINNNRNPADKKENKLLLTQYGVPYTRSGEARKLIESFNRLLGTHSEGVSIGSLRHTYATIIDQIPDQSMIDLTMGHTNKSIQKRVYRQLNINELARLKEISDKVRYWIYEL